MFELSKLSGRFIGKGINHEGQDFIGTFEARPVGPDDAVGFSFLAAGKDGAVYHNESSLIGKNLRGQLALWIVSTNHPGVFERPVKSQEALGDRATYVFGYGDPRDSTTFREEVLLELAQNSVRYVYSWGLPGGEFAERSGCTMTRG